MGQTGVVVEKISAPGRSERAQATRSLNSRGSRASDCRARERSEAPAGIAQSSNVQMGSRMTCPEVCGAGGNVAPDDRFAPEGDARRRRDIYPPRSIDRHSRPADVSPRSPWQNAYAERLIGSIRRECLDHIVVFGERHLRHVLLSYKDYYNRASEHPSVYVVEEKRLC